MRDLTSATTQIAKDSKRDSEIMKTITVVTMVYLPATFVAVCALSIIFISGVLMATQTLMSMGIFDFYFPDGTSSVAAGVRVSPKGWIYAATTVPLTLITLLLAWLWMRWTGRKVELQYAGNTTKAPI